MHTNNPIIKQFEYHNISSLDEMKKSNMLRDCFDFQAYEYRQTTCEEKIEAIEYIKKEYNTNIHSLVMALMEHSKESTFATIKPIDIALALSELLDNKTKV